MSAHRWGKERITSSPDVLSGEPVFCRTRIPLPSNLYLGVKPRVIQASLRHCDISVTLDFYVETPQEQAREALDKLSSLI